MRTALLLAFLVGVSRAQPVPVGPEIDAQPVYYPPLPDYPENNLLTGAEKLFEGEIVGPEAFAKDPLDDNVLYTGLGDGRVVRFVRAEGTDDLTVETFARTGEDLPNCGEAEVEVQCGRPLGMHFDETGDNLLVLDPYQGLLSFTRNGTKTLLTDRVTGASEPFTFLNALIVDEDTGDVYITETSQDRPLTEAFYGLLEGKSSGRLIKYTKATGETSVLVDDIRFPNGLTFSHDKKHIYVNLFLDAKIGRYTLPRPQAQGRRHRRRNKGRWKEDWVTNLPGTPDNIVQRTSERPDGRKTYFIGCVMRRAAGFSFLDTIGPYPSVKRDFARYVPLLDIVFNLIGMYGNVIEIDDDGEIVQSLQDPTAGVAWISEAIEFGDHLYLGTSLFPWIARVSRDTYV